MYRFLVAAGYIILCLVYGDWAKWRQYYPTILYVFVGDLLYNFLFFNHPLWLYEGWGNHTFPNLFYMFFAYPFGINVFLTHFPKGHVKALGYILAWSASMVTIELVSYLNGLFSYHNGWHIIYTSVFNIAGFSLIQLHHKRPLVAWPCTAALLLAAAWHFKLPLNMLR